MPFYQKLTMTSSNIPFSKLFELLISAAICFNLVDSFHEIFHSQFLNSPVYLPTCKFAQKSANYDYGDKNVKLCINWCIIFDLICENIFKT